MIQYSSHSGVVINVLHRDREVRGSHPGRTTILLGSSVGKLLSHITSPVFSAPETRVQKGVF